MVVLEHCNWNIGMKLIESRNHEKEAMFRSGEKYKYRTEIETELQRKKEMRF